MRWVEAYKLISKNTSWNELNSSLEKLVKSEKYKFVGDIFEVISKHYLLTDPRYQSTLKNVWLLDEIPEHIRLKLNLPKQDEGIDLIAETKIGTYWAIQSKFRSNSDESLTLSGKGGLATFSSLAFNYCKNISHGLILTTVSKPPKKIELLKNIGFETLESFLSLDDNDCEMWKILTGSCLKKIIKPNKYFPKPHQIIAINKTKKYFKKNDRGKIVMPCGTGKSLVAFWIAKEMQAKNILIAVPSLALIQQTLKMWTREFLIHDMSPDWMCVCSDQSVKENQDSFISFTYDLGIEVTTKEEEISHFLNKKTLNQKIIFTTYHSAKKICSAAGSFNFDLAIMDEAHKTVGHSDKLSATLIHQKNIKIKKRLFMTATERIFKANNDEYLSMDSVKDYGNIIYELSFKAAIEANPPIISDYKIITYGVTNSEIQEIHNNNKFIRVKKELENITAREFATAIALRKAINQLNIKNAVSFHSSVQRASNFQKQQKIIDDVYPEYKSLNTYHVTGEMAVSKRASQMRLFAENFGLMTNCRCLTEGVDMPAIDCVCFTDPKRSKIDIVQASGRALRLSSSTDKKFGYILVPLFVPDDLDPETASKGSSFDEIITVLGALSTHDSRIKEYLKAISEGKKPTVGSKVDGLITMNILTQIDTEKFNKAILIKVWDKIARVNCMTFKEAKILARRLNIKTSSEFRKLKKEKTLPPDMPLTPNFYYKEWEGWHNFLDTPMISGGKLNRRHLKFRSYELAKKYVQDLNIKNFSELKEYIKKNTWPIDLPKHKNMTAAYQEDFLNEDFFGLKIEFMNYEEAKKNNINLGLVTRLQFLLYNQINRKRKIYTLPKNPERYYRKDWKGWSHFLGIEINKNLILKGKRHFISFTKAKYLVRVLQIKSSAEYLKYAQTRGNLTFIPSIPKDVYKGEWKGWGDFLNIKEN